MTPRNYIPGILIAEMARHIKYKGTGIGNVMINWVVSKEILSKVACKIIIGRQRKIKIVYTKDSAVLNLYRILRKNGI